MARCKVYEIQGPDPARRWRAERCVRPAAGKTTVDGKSYPICKRHKSRSWNLFIGDGWLYAIDLTADAAKPKKRK
jgi:hypothetical protein